MIDLLGKLVPTHLLAYLGAQLPLQAFRSGVGDVEQPLRRAQRLVPSVRRKEVRVVGCEQGELGEVPRCLLYTSRCV